ncbi:hypothetical protein SAY87_024022 [Trapa incisa]|uniref:F-box domain-containing protein n=1 Tax=Trapa incisa TaxID=236973 RepID=A0AAN7L7F0_9MYRT|nr:hypothetical protein SAY87_024022 [Trapa incisa]
MEDEKKTLEADFISSLPDDILRHISSFVPTKEAMRTAVLSTRWRRLWMPNRLSFYLDTDSAEMNRGAFVEMVVGTSLQALAGKFLGSFEAPEALELCFSGRGSELMTIKATKGVEKVLHLHFSDNNIKHSGSCSLILQHAASTVAYTVSELRRLHLVSLASIGSGFVSSLFSICHLLQSLSIEGCTGLESITIDKNSSLQELAILDCPNLDSVFICALELKSFRYRGALGKIELNSMLSLEEVELDLRDGHGPGEFDCEEVLSLLESMKDVQGLRVSGWLLERLCSAGVIYGKLDFQFSRLKALYWTDSSITSTKRDSLACFLNMCPELTELIVQVGQALAQVETPVVHHYWHEPHLWRDFDAVKADVLPLKHLKTVRVVLGNLTAEELRLSLMELLLERAVAIESMSFAT